MTPGVASRIARSVPSDPDAEPGILWCYCDGGSGGIAMYRLILYSVASLLVAAVQPAADDCSECQISISNEAIAACSRLLALNPNDADAECGRGTTNHTP